MSDEDPILDPGDPSEANWRPAVSLQHDAERHELYVVVGEEVGSMTEGVSTASFEEIRRRLALLDSVESLRAGIKEARRLLYQTRPAPLAAAIALNRALFDEAHTPGGIAGGVLDGTYDPGGPTNPGGIAEAPYAPEPQRDPGDPDAWGPA